MFGIPVCLFIDRQEASVAIYTVFLIREGNLSETCQILSVFHNFNM